MADTKGTALNEITTAAPSDIVIGVDDPGGSPETKKITLQNLLEAVNALTDLGAVPASTDQFLMIDDPAGTPTAKRVDASNLVAASSTTVAGKIEVAIASEVNTGTDAARAVSPDSLAGSNYGTATVTIQIFDDGTDVSTGDGAGDTLWRVPSTLNGFDLVAANAYHQTAGTTGSTVVMIHNVTQAADMLTTGITVATGDLDSADGGSSAAGDIDTDNDDVATGDKIRIDVDSVTTTAPKGLWVELQFRLP